MAITVITGKDCPIVTHIGIFRSPFLKKYEGEPIEWKELTEGQTENKLSYFTQECQDVPLPARYSIKFHQQIAQEIRILYPEKEAIIIPPLKSMYEVLTNIFGSEIRITSVEKILMEDEEYIEIKYDSDNKSYHIKKEVFQANKWLESVTYLVFDNPKVFIPYELILSGNL